jgi:hypothetical protein
VKRDLRDHQRSRTTTTTEQRMAGNPQQADIEALYFVTQSFALDFNATYLMFEILSTILESNEQDRAPCIPSRFTFE